MFIQCSNVSELNIILRNTDEIRDFPELREALVKIVKKEGYKNCDVRKKTVSTKGSNFLGILHEVDIKGTTSNGDKKETHLFIKQATVLNRIRVVSIENIFAKEVFFYAELAKIFEKFQNDANVPENERFNMPKGYDESNGSAIILENLTRKGYKHFNRAEGISLKCAELTMEQLARFHGLSFVMQKRMPEYYDMKVRVEKFPFNYDDDWNVLLANICKKAVEVVDDDMKEKVKKLLPIMQNDCQNYLTDDDSPVCVLAHGDCKPHNMMMKEIDGETVSAMMIDYQLMYHGCPVTDIIFYIFSCTDQEFRRKHLEHLKNLYHDSLGKFLSHFGMDVEAMFSRKQYECLYSERLMYGLLTGMFMSFFSYISEEDAPDFSSCTFSELTVNPTEKFVNSVRGLLDDFVQWGYL